MNNTDAALPVIGITMGDPGGIGPEILVAALSSPDLYGICRPLVLGDLNIIRKAAAFLKTDIRPVETDAPEKADFRFGYPDIIGVSDMDMKNFMPARPTPETGRAMLGYITAAADLAMANRIDAIVTAPITKTALRMAGSRFHGHTELIAHLTGAAEYAMMLAGERLKVVLVTVHIPVADIARSLDRQRILLTIRITHTALKERFGIPSPRLAVAGLNPHAGEDSMFGPEEKDTIAPAVNDAREEGIDAAGPFPPDTLFCHAVNGAYDSVVCMYHDQGLIPFKMIHFEDGVNTTLGLPVIRTSVDHGTAYDIAWKGVASHRSLTAAIKMASFQSVNRKKQTP